MQRSWGMGPCGRKKRKAGVVSVRVEIVPAGAEKIDKRTQLGGQLKN